MTAPPRSDPAFFATAAGRKLLFASLYLSEGAPIGFIWWALPTRLRAAGVPVDEITALTSILILPWMFKFAWAPLVDTLRTPRWNLPEWIVSMQVPMGLCLLPMAFLDITQDYALMVPLLLLHAILAATQDTSIDALGIALVPDSERGSVNGWMQTGMLAGRACFGGGALLLGEQIGEEGVIFLLVGVIWVSTALVSVAKRTFALPPSTERFAARWQTYFATLRCVAVQKKTWAGLLFAIISGAGFEAVGAVAGPFLIDRGFSKSDVGLFFGIPVMAGMISGALLGGYVSDRFGRTRSVGFFLILISVTIFTLALVDAVPGVGSGALSITLLSVLYLSIGMFTAGSYAMFMDITNARLGATQFSTYMGATNGCESWATLTVGKMIPSFGYPVAFGVMAAVSLASLPLLGLLRSSNKKH